MDEATVLVRDHLQELSDATGWKKVAGLVDEVDESVVIIGSCKAVQCLRNLSCAKDSFDFHSGSQSGPAHTNSQLRWPEELLLP